MVGRYFSQIIPEMPNYNNDNTTKVFFLSLLLSCLIPHCSRAWEFATRRKALKQGFGLAVGGGSFLLFPSDVAAQVVPVTIEGPKESLGIQITNTRREGRSIVVIQRVIAPKSPDLAPGMILKGYPTADDLILRLEKGPFPFTLEFVTEDSLPIPTPYSITTLKSPSGPCKIQSQRGDVLELEYEAKYVANGQKIIYDASSFRGTGQPYQMVLGSGDMIPGVDQGLVGMCPGEVRRLQIPPALAYGPRARDAFRIPVDYQGLEWTIQLVSIEGTIRADNNDQTRQERTSS